MIDNKEFYSRLESLEYSEFDFENFTTITNFKTTTKPELGNKPDFRNIGTFDILQDEQTKQLNKKNKSKIL